MTLSLIGQIKYLTITVLILLVCSCEYEPPEKLTIVNPDSSPPTLINQTLDLNADTLFIWCATQYKFDLNSSGQSIQGVNIKYLGDYRDISSNKGSFIIEPGEYPDGIYNVQMNVYTHSGTGSLADKLGLEAFMFSKEWILIIERPSNIRLSFTQTTIENGFLKIQWQKFKKPYFHSYKIYVNDSSLLYNFSKTIHDADSTFIIDSSFVGGKVQCSLLLSLKSGDDGFVTDYLTYRYPVSFIFNEGPDSMKISWTHIPFNHTYFLYSHSTLISQGKSDSYTIKSPGMGYEIDYKLSIKPVVKLKLQNQMHYVFCNYTYGIKTPMTFSRMIYDPEINAFFLKYAMFLRKYDGTTLVKSAGYDYSYDYYDNSTIAISPDKSYAFTTEDQDLIQLNSSTFTVISKNKFGPSISGPRTFSLMQILNDSLMYITYDSNLGIYNYKTGTIISSIGFTGSSAKPFNISISKDGKYVANCGNGYLRIFRNNDNLTLEKIYETSGSFMECIFDPVNIENILIVTLEKTYFLHCPDMVLISEIPRTVRGYAVNFDPATNYLLFVSDLYKTITVYDWENNIVKFTCNHHAAYSQFYLGNNSVFHWGGYKINAN